MLALQDSKEVDVLQEKVSQHCYNTAPVYPLYHSLFVFSCSSKRLGSPLPCEGHQKSITPYIHSLVYHVPEMIRKLGSIKPFSGHSMPWIMHASISCVYHSCEACTYLKAQGSKAL